MITGTNIDLFQEKVLLKGLELEIQGMKRKGRTCYAIIKERFGLHGNKKKVHDQFENILKEKSYQKHSI